MKIQKKFVHQTGNGGGKLDLQFCSRSERTGVNGRPRLRFAVS